MSSKSIKAFAIGVLVSAVGTVTAELIKGYINKNKAAK
ncbi:hypothetical protein AN213_00443 [Pseudoalteromonas sp. P1-8]|nr:hypothetical protein AN213_00443 [Pseudoalteromonas sp. P1-8]